MDPQAWDGSPVVNDLPDARRVARTICNASVHHAHRGTISESVTAPRRALQEPCHWAVARSETATERRVWQPPCLPQAGVAAWHATSIERVGLCEIIMSISEVLPLDVAGSSSPAPVVAAPRAAAVSALVSPAIVAREAVVVAMLVAGLTALLAPRDLGFGVAPHPAWAAVILLSARYGSRGFGFALFAVWGTLTLTALAMDVPLGPLLSAAGNSVPDLTALVLSVLVAWISSAHERRIDDLSARGVELAQKSTGDDAIVAELQGAAMALRARADRLDHSVTFIRDVAARLEGGDPLLGSQAALELAIARTGARAGVVQLVDERGRLRTVASLGAWTLLRARPPDVLLDRTIEAAFESAASVRAIDLPEGGRDQSDVATPIVDEAGEALGVLALRGVPPDSLSHALVHDLGLIARWCAKTNASRGLAVDQTTAASGEPARRPAPPGADDSPPSGSQRLN